MFIKVRIYLFVAAISVTTCASTYARFYQRNDGSKQMSDSLSLKNDTIRKDTVPSKKKNEEFKSKIEYSAKDSTPLSADQRTAYLYGDAVIKYPAENIELTAAFIEYDMANSQVYAMGMKDSTGQIKGNPVFKKGTDTYNSKYLSYNFKTRKAFIKDVITKQSDGILHSEQTKRNSDGTINVKNGIYTTCDAPHPHYGMVLTKGKVIPNDKIVFGPAYFVFEDVPLPIGVPFGFFPNKRESTSGVIIPAYGEEVSRGFYLRDGGYYFAMSDYYDLLLKGTIYSRGTWGVGGSTNYKRIYKYSGNFDASYYLNKTGIAGIDSGSNQLTKAKDFSIKWSHRQEAQANPNSSFSANVDYSSSSYDRNYNYQNAQSLMTSQAQSSIQYSHTWTNFNLSTSARANQNRTTEMVTLGLPSASFSANRIYLFRSKEYSGEQKWYENISINYTSQLDNNITANENQVFSRKAFRNAQNGYRHSIPLSLNIKFWQYFNFTPSLTYSGMFYGKHIKKEAASTTDVYTGITTAYDKIDTIRGLKYAHGIAPTASVSVAPTIYGMAQFRSTSFIKAIRHVMTPSLSYSLTPQINGIMPSYYRDYTSYTGKKSTYSIFEGQIYGTPTSVSRRSQNISFGLGNNVEMKVRSDKDTVTGEKKIVLIQSLSISSSYNPEAEHFKLSSIAISGVTPLPIKDVSVSYNGTVNPYVLNKQSVVVDTFYWTKHPRIGRLTHAGLSFGYSFTLGKKSDQDGPGKDKPKGNKDNKDSNAKLGKGPDKKRQKTEEEFNYFQIPVTFSFSYNLSFSNEKHEKAYVQSLTFNGTVPLTPKWMITYSSGYDFKNKKFSYTSVTIHRDLHCWEMNMTLSPFGTYKFYEFKISAKTSILRDLKYEQRKDYRDYSY